MKDLHYSIRIDAPREKVWDTMLGKATYPEWTNVFNPAGSEYEGDWEEEGSTIRFLGKDEEGNASMGMAGRIKECRPHEFVSVEQFGEIENGEEKPWGEGKVAYENYTFADEDGGTLLSVDLSGIPDEYAGMFDDTWPKALETLKGMCER